MERLRKKRPLCIGVTQLTSTSQEQMNLEQNIDGSLEDRSFIMQSLLSRPDWMALSVRRMK